MSSEMYRLIFTGITLSLGGGVEENLMLTFIQRFGKMHNLSSIRSCLPMPHSAGEHIPWGIIPRDLTMVIQYNNLTEVIAKANVTHYLDEKQRCR